MASVKGRVEFTCGLSRPTLESSEESGKGFRKLRNFNFLVPLLNPSSEGLEPSVPSQIINVELSRLD